MQLLENLCSEDITSCDMLVEEASCENKKHWSRKQAVASRCCIHITRRQQAEEPTANNIFIIYTNTAAFLTFWESQFELFHCVALAGMFSHEDAVQAAIVASYLIRPLGRLVSIKIHYYPKLNNNTQKDQIDLATSNVKVSSLCLDL